MKRKGLFLVTLILAICMVSQTMVLAAWVPYYGEQQASGYAVRVHKSWNDAGQTVYTAYNSYGGVILDIRARGGNIWNETTQVLCTSNNKGPDYVGIAEELDVYGLNHASNPMEYRNGFEAGEVPYVLQDVYATGMQTDDNGVLIGFKTSNGVVVGLDGNGYQTNSNNYWYNNNNYNSQYARVVQDGNDYNYYYSDNNYYTYNFNPNTRYLKNNSSKLSNISEIAFGKGYIGAVTTSNTVSIIPIGQGLQVVHEYDEYFEEWIYESNNSYWIVGYRDIYGRSHKFDSYNNNYNNSLNNGFNNNFTTGTYPNFYQDGTRLVYNSNANTTYVYSLTSKKLTFNGSIISYSAEQVEFSKGYIVFVNASHECRRARLGSTMSEHVCYNFVEFNYDYDGFVTEAISSRTGNHDV